MPPFRRCVLTSIASAVLVSPLVAQFNAETCLQSIPNPEPLPDVGDWFGYSVTSLGEFDGVPGLELVVGAPDDEEAINEPDVLLGSGAVWIQSLDVDGFPLGAVKVLPQGPAATIAEGDQFGVSVAAMGDLNGDGYSDLAVGARGRAGGGAVEILFLGLDAGGLPEVIGSRIIDAAAMATSGAPLQGFGEDSFGFSVACLGDVDDDGVPDLGVGAIGHRASGTSGGDQEGALYVIPLEGGPGNPDAGRPKPGQTVRFDENDLIGLPGVAADPLDDMYLFGSAVCPVGDLDGDGDIDLCVGVDYDGFVPDDPGTPENEMVLGTGAAYLLRIDLGAAQPLVATQKIAGDNVGGFSEILGDHDVFGSALALMETRTNGAKIAVGAFATDDGGYGGAIWIVDVAYDPGADAMAVTNQCKYSGMVGQLICAQFEPAGWFGSGIAVLGDVYPAGAPDGVIDLAVGEPHRTPLGVQSFQGRLWVLPRGEPSDFKNMQFGLAGAVDEPFLSASGDLTAGSDVTFSLQAATSNTTAFWVIGLSTVNAPFKGGTLLPATDVVTPVAIGLRPSVAIPVTWPTGVPSGSRQYHQFWIQDAGGPAGFSASNGLSITQP